MSCDFRHFQVDDLVFSVYCRDGYGRLINRTRKRVEAKNLSAESLGQRIYDLLLRGRELPFDASTLIGLLVHVRFRSGDTNYFDERDASYFLALVDQLGGSYQGNSFFRALGVFVQHTIDRFEKPMEVAEVSYPSCFQIYLRTGDPMKDSVISVDPALGDMDHWGELLRQTVRSHERDRAEIKLIEFVWEGVNDSIDFCVFHGVALGMGWPMAIVSRIRDIVETRNKPAPPNISSARPYNRFYTTSYVMPEAEIYNIKLVMGGSWENTHVHGEFRVGHLAGGEPVQVFFHWWDCNRGNATHPVAFYRIVGGYSVEKHRILVGWFKRHLMGHVSYFTEKDLQILREESEECMKDSQSRFRCVRCSDTGSVIVSGDGQTPSRSIPCTECPGREPVECPACGDNGYTLKLYGHLGDSWSGRNGDSDYFAIPCQACKKYSSIPVATREYRRKHHIAPFVVDGEMQERYKDAIFFVEGEDYTKFALWQEYHNQITWPGKGCQSWGIEIGRVDHRPVVLMLTGDHINGKLVVFYYVSSQMSDSTMVEDWLKTNFPGVPCVDGFNFGQVLHACGGLKEWNEKRESMPSEGVEPIITDQTVSHSSLILAEDGSSTGIVLSVNMLQDCGDPIRSYNFMAKIHKDSGGEDFETERFYQACESVEVDEDGDLCVTSRIFNRHVAAGSGDPYRGIYGDAADAVVFWLVVTSLDTDNKTPVFQECFMLKYIEHGVEKYDYQNSDVARLETYFQIIESFTRAVPEDYPLG